MLNSKLFRGCLLGGRGLQRRSDFIKWCEGWWGQRVQMAENGTLECANEGSRFPSWLSPSHINWLPKNIPTPTPSPLFLNSPECPPLHSVCRWSWRTLGCSWDPPEFPPCCGTTGTGSLESPPPPSNAALRVCLPGRTWVRSIWARRAWLYGTQEIISEKHPNTHTP